jgi:hypothetical protein
MSGYTAGGHYFWDYLTKINHLPWLCIVEQEAECERWSKKETNVAFLRYHPCNSYGIEENNNSKYQLR